MDELEAERNRLAARLQQALIDPLGLLVAQAAVYEQSLAAQPGARTAIGVMAALARQLLQQARDLEANLRPTALQELGLEAGLQLLAGRIMRSSGVAIHLSLPRAARRLPPALELACYRATQEAIERAVAAHSQRITVQLRYDQHRIELAIDDDGAPADRLTGMETLLARIARLGGQFEQRAGASGGLALRLTLEHTPLEQLTAREQEVLALLAEGLSTRAIAARLARSPRTVSYHLEHIYAKLGVRSRAEAILYALRTRE